MSAALLYRPNQRSAIWAAFAGAVLLHVAAVAIAENHPRMMIAPTGDDSGAFLEVSSQPDDPIPPELPEPPLAPPLMASENPMFPTDEATPPPKAKKTRAEPLVRAPIPGPIAPARLGAVRVLALSAPRPEYPYEARRLRVTGSGVALLTIDPVTGQVAEVVMSRSTGSVVLDNATISGFRRWRFRPGTIARVQSPVTYTLTGAAY